MADVDSNPGYPAYASGLFAAFVKPEGWFVSTLDYSLQKVVLLCFTLLSCSGDYEIQSGNRKGNPGR